ncbi:MAG: coproporphyrinogen-III oxidase family protein [Planctomycetota bacterium]
MSDPEMTSLPVLEADDKKTTVGNYFVSNYPPYSTWSTDHRSHALGLFDTPAPPGTPLGLYIHIPFCRKRCNFCYFRVYTDKTRDEVTEYLDAVLEETRRYARTQRIAGRKLKFVYFGGGTPSYLSEKQLSYLFNGLKDVLDWSEVEEVAFECEPGTLSTRKLDRLKDLGVTRISLGIENFNDEVLELNNRAHRSKQVGSAYDWAKDAGFEQVNIDLIAGMLGETDENWQRNIDTLLQMRPEAVTVYQMEVPYNTKIYQAMKESGAEEAPVADWGTKRRWVTQVYAALEEAGYDITSAYTAVRDAGIVKFIYRDALWAGADMLAVGVSSFGYLNAPADASAGLAPGGGMHYQNQHDIVPYTSAVVGGEAPLFRALPIDREEAMIREWVLQLKIGRISRLPFIEKFGVDPFEKWADILQGYVDDGLIRIKGDELFVPRQTLLRIDRLLYAFFKPEHQDVRYA